MLEFNTLGNAVVILITIVSTKKVIFEVIPEIVSLLKQARTWRKE